MFLRCDVTRSRICGPPAGHRTVSGCAVPVSSQCGAGQPSRFPPRRTPLRDVPEASWTRYGGECQGPFLTVSVRWRHGASRPWFDRQRRLIYGGLISPDQALYQYRRERARFSLSRCLCRSKIKPLQPHPLSPPTGAGGGCASTRSPSRASSTTRSRVPGRDNATVPLGRMAMPTSTTAPSSI